MNEYLFLIDPPAAADALGLVPWILGTMAATVAAVWLAFRKSEEAKDRLHEQRIADKQAVIEALRSDLKEERLRTEALRIEREKFLREIQQALSTTNGVIKDVDTSLNSLKDVLLNLLKL